MGTTNRGLLTEAFDELTTGLRGFVVDQLRSRFGREWTSRFPAPRTGERLNLDAYALLRCINESSVWDQVFRLRFGRRERSLVNLLLDARNRWAHGESFSDDDAQQIVHGMWQLLTAIGEPPALEAAERLGLLKRGIRRPEPGEGSEGADRARGFQVSLADLEAARNRFHREEPRDLFYRAATELIRLSIKEQTTVTVEEALAVLLQTWNKSYYRFRPFTEQHLNKIEGLIEQHRSSLKSYRGRSITTMRPAERPVISSTFSEFAQVLGPVGAAKALHLLAPNFFPLWDRAIAKGYGLPLLSGENAGVPGVPGQPRN